MKPNKKNLRKIIITTQLTNKNLQDNNQNNEIYDRGEEGFKVYAKGMDGSQKEKAKILPYIKKGKIAEMGCGNGAVLEILSTAFQKSEICGIDISDAMLEISMKRNYKHDNVIISKGDVREKTFGNNSLDTIIYCSTLHEVYSYSGYDKKVLRKTIQNTYEMLKPGGRLIIRDGVKPENQIVYMGFNNKKTKEKFKRFAKEFGPYEIPYIWERDKAKLRSEDAMEFLSKYIYDINWDIEVKEQFGVYTKKEYADELKKLGFKVICNKSYLIKWLRVTHYEKDVKLYTKNNNKFKPRGFPHSTVIIVGEKPKEDRK
ncbi:methyltransferase [Candidatus Woesearchaeota archaeon]|nr:methyltransferase [Candidatus Woesearchaeota archaeon]